MVGWENLTHDRGEKAHRILLSKLIYNGHGWRLAHQ
jgi:hypothetical protein